MLFYQAEFNSAYTPDTMILKRKSVFTKNRHGCTCNVLLRLLSTQISNSETQPYGHLGHFFLPRWKLRWCGPPLIQPPLALVRLTTTFWNPKPVQSYLISLKPPSMFIFQLLILRTMIQAWIFFFISTFEFWDAY